MKDTDKICISMFAALIATAALFIVAACKKDVERGVAGEKALDGKMVVTEGCIWYYATSGTECGTDDVLAFCADGRICVSPNGENWKCVQFANSHWTHPSGEVESP